MKENAGLACFGLFALAIAPAMNGWALSVLWGWFVVPLFDVTPLSIPTAIGFALVIGMLTHQQQQVDHKKKEWSDIVAGLISRSILTPLFFVLFGWIVKSFT